MKLVQLIPEEKEIDLDQLVRMADEVGQTTQLRPFSELAMVFCSGFAKTLLSDPKFRHFPELVALGFWMREAELKRWKKDFESFARPPIFVMPLGTVFHMPPANVDSVFMYSLVISLLCGNRNLVRISRRSNPGVGLLLNCLTQLLSERVFRELRTYICVLSYGHEVEITKGLSSVADLRVIWGGDTTIDAIRSIPLPAHSREIAFPDRFSMSAIKSVSYLQSSDAEKQELAERFFNDSYWFDQMACSCSKLVVWCGPKDSAVKAGDLFFRYLSDIACAKGYQLNVGEVLSKVSFSYQSVLDLPVTCCRTYGNHLTVISLESMEHFNRNHCGGGLFFELNCKDLSELASHIIRKDQTLGHFGFTHSELTGFVETVGCRGLSRIVPIGKALSFQRFWDGYDLFKEMTRMIHLGT